MKIIFNLILLFLLMGSCQKKTTAFLLTPSNKLPLRIFLNEQESSAWGLPIQANHSDWLVYIKQIDTNRLFLDKYTLIFFPMIKDTLKFHLKSVDLSTEIQGQFIIPSIITPGLKPLMNILTYQIDTVKIFLHYVPIRVGTWKIHNLKVNTIIHYNTAIVIIQDPEKDPHGH